jgi:uncharacterized protein (TIGR02117 family)
MRATTTDRRARRGGGWAAAVVLLLIVLMLATARGGDPALYPAKPGDQVAIFLVEDGFHTDLALPRDAIGAHVGPLATATTQTSSEPWVLIGWGDARFYEAGSAWQGRVLDGVAALFGGRPTVMHLQGVWESPSLAWKTGVHRLVLSRAGLAALMTRTDQSFALGADGQPIGVDAPHAVGEAFFQSREGFSLVHVCNHWVGQLLSAAGVPVTPVLDTLPVGLLLDLKLRADL